MITKLSMIAKGIAIAVVIGIIIKLILPENSNKKYIKVVISLFILFTIISPVIGKKTDLNDIDFENYLKNETELNGTESSEKIKENYNNSIKEKFINKTIKTINEKLNAKEIYCNKIEIKIDDSFNITEIKMSGLYKDDNKNSKEKNENNTKVNKIAINEIEEIDLKNNINGISSNTSEDNSNGKSKISDYEKEKIIEYLEENFKVDEKNIILGES